MQEILDDQERLLRTVSRERNRFKKLLHEIDNKSEEISTATQTDGVKN